MKTNVRKGLVSLVITLALLAGLWSVSRVLAQDPGQLQAAASTPTTESFTYQGTLMEGGSPATGSYDFVFVIYDSETGGTAIGSPYSADDQPVSDGKFTVYIQPGAFAAVFNGGPRWLEVQVRPGSSSGAYTALPRQPITPVPYAWGLHPHAIIQGPAIGYDFGESILNVSNDDLLHSAIFAQTASGAAIKAEGNTGNGLYAHSSNNYAVWGDSDNSYGGYFTSDQGNGIVATSNGTNHYDHGAVISANWGYGVYATSAHNMALRGESGAWATVYGRNTGTGYGVYGTSHSGGGIYGYSTSGTAVAGTSQVGDLLELWSGAAFDRRFRVTNGGDVYADGSYNCGLGGSCFNTGTGADVAERVEASEAIGPGDVVEIDPDNPAHFRLSSQPFSTLVAGVVSSNPAITMNNNDLADNDGSERMDDRPLLALVGQVPVKVTAENGAIAPGDMLVASSTPGHAMRAGAHPPQGTVIGKALEPLAESEGSGLILMLVMLQ